MNRYFVGIYCPPQPQHGAYPARNTEKAFTLLKDAGVDHVFGHYEDKKSIDTLIQSLENADKAGVSFYPRLKVFDGFLGIDGAIKPPSVSYNNLSSDEKERLHGDFEDMLALCARHPSFGGILMGDERGYDTFEGIGAAQRHFSDLYPDKLFMYNNLNYFIDDHLFFYSATEVDCEEKRLEGDLCDGAENRFRRYDKFIGHYMDCVKAEYISTDVYPFAPTWKEAITSIHRCLYEVQSFFADLKERTGVKPLTYVQVGNWNTTPRDIGKNEISLHLAVAAAYNFDGFMFFPGCFPNDWLDAKEGEEGYGISTKIGLLDDDGEPTVYYYDTARLIRHFTKIGELLEAASWLGVSVTGEFVGGFSEDELAPLKWNECIYRGGLPENERHEYTGDIPVTGTSSQLFIGAFSGNGGKSFIIANNSIVTDCTVTLDKNAINGLVINAEYTEHIPDTVTLSEGECILAVTK